MEERERMSGSGGLAVDELWTGGSCRSIAWEERPRRGKPLKSRVANFSEKKGTLLLRFSGCGNGMWWPEFCCRGAKKR